MMITTLFCDLGGVLLTNGWDTASRKKAAQHFNYDFAAADARHQLLFGDYELGKITLDTYLHYTIFYEPKKFTPEEYKQFMYAQSEALPGMLPFIQEVRQQKKLKIVAVSNEGKELTDYRIKTFGLEKIFDMFIVSCYVGVKKPDKRIFEIALGVSQSQPGEVAYLEDRELFVEIARSMGIHGIHHTSLSGTKEALREKVDVF